MPGYQRMPEYKKHRYVFYDKKTIYKPLDKTDICLVLVKSTIYQVLLNKQENDTIPKIPYLFSF